MISDVTRSGGDAPVSVVIVGAGQAGGAAADALRTAGYEGPITLIGDETLPPYERPPLSKDVLLGRAAAEQTFLFALDHYDAIGVTLELGVSVEAIDRAARTVRLADGRTFPYGALILATGARARRLAMPGGEGERVHYLRTHADAGRLKDGIVAGGRILIVGAGFIGLEVASSARSLGAEVVVVEAGERPLARLLPPGFSDWMTHLHEAQSVTIRCGRSLVAIRETDGGVAIELDDGSVLEGDQLVVGIGAIPNVELAEAAGLECRDGIVVDEECRTSDPGIFAIGDVARHVDPLFAREWRLESWRNALLQAAKVANAIVGAPLPAAEAPWFWTDQYQRNIQIAGVPDASLTLVERGDQAAGAYIAFYLDGAMVSGAIGVDAGRDMRIARDLIRKQTPVDAEALADGAKRLPRP